MGRSVGMWLVAVLLGCQSMAVVDSGTGSGPADPTKKEVVLGRQGDWEACLLLDQEEVGIWTVKPYSVWDMYGCPEIVGLDDKGRCQVLISYSGKWTPRTAVDDVTWLGGMTHGDVDPRIDGTELYVGGKAGNLYQVLAHREGVLDSRRISVLPGREIHTIVAAPETSPSAGGVLYVFTRPGGLYKVSPDGEHGRFQTRLLMELPGRVRDAAVLAPAADGAFQVATVGRAGTVQILTFRGDEVEFRTLFETAMGIGRITQNTVDGKRVLYVTVDDGQVVRLEERATGPWQAEVIHRGTPGPRGLAAGRFHVEEDVESVALFGYSGNVELLTQTADGWTSEVLFTDRDKGHWLCAAEVDGRNQTLELFASGYGGRIVMLRRVSDS